MTIIDLRRALTAGRNLILHRTNKVFVLDLIEESRPTNCLTIRRLDSGAEYITRPDAVISVVGTVDTTLLPWRKEREHSDVPSDVLPQMSLAIPAFLPNGTRLTPGSRITFVNGRTGTYLGSTLSRPKYPLDVLVNGRRMKASPASICNVLKQDREQGDGDAA